MRFEALKNFKSVDKKYYTEKTSRSKNDSYKTNENNSNEKERNDSHKIEINDSYKKERNDSYKIEINDSYKTNENNSHKIERNDSYKKERNDSYKKERNELDILNSITEFPELTNSKKILEKKPTINYKNICYKDKPKNLIKTNDILQNRYYNYEIEPDILD